MAGLNRANADVFASIIGVLGRDGPCRFQRNPRRFGTRSAPMNPRWNVEEREA